MFNGSGIYFYVKYEVGVSITQLCCSDKTKWSIFRSIIFPNSANTFITNVLKSLSNKLVLLHYLFFRCFALQMSISFAFFHLTFYASVNLGETVTCCHIEWMFFCEKEYPYPDCMCPVCLVVGLNLIGTKVTYFFGMCDIYHPGRGCRWK